MPSRAHDASTVPMRWNGRREREFHALFDLALDAMVIASDDGQFLDANPAACELLGIERPQLLGRRLFELVEGRDQERMADSWRRFLHTGATRGEFRLRTFDAGRRDIEFSAKANIFPGRHLSILRDVTQTRRVQEALEFAALASSVLASSLDYDTTMQSVARLGVSFLADWCAVDIREAGGRLHRRAVARQGTGEAGGGTGDKAEFDRVTAAVAAQVCGAGQTQVFPEIPGAVPPPTVLPAAQVEQLRGVGLRSLMVMPLAVHGRILGTLSLGSIDEAGPLEPSHLAFAEDLAYRAALATDAARLFHEAQQADRRKDEFLAMLAHELRNPLAPMLTTLETMRHRIGADADLESARQRLERQARHMARLVDDLLDISRITRGAIQLRPEPLELTQSVSLAIESSRALLEVRGHQLSVEIAGEPLRVSGDPARVEQVFCNLLSNAAKYTEPGGRIQVRVWREAALAVVSVRDNGIGIPQEMLGRVFDLFVQVNPSLDRVSGGLGLGLTLVRTLVQMHGGTVTAASEGLGKGSEFTVRLPLLSQPAVRPSQAHSRGERTQGRRLKIAIGEDNLDAQESLRDLLELWGHRVRAAGTGPEVLELLTAEAFDVGFVDVGLPGLSGYEVAQRVRQAETGAPGRHTFLVAITGYGQPEDRAAALQAGFDAHRTKPVDMEDLMALLTSLP